MAIARFWHSFLRIEKAILLACCAALLFFAGSAWSRNRSVQQLPPVFEDAPKVAGAAASSKTGAPILVHVAGEVKRPGVLSLRSGARVADALSAAGGAKAGGDMHALNLAQKLKDGEQIRVPRRGEANFVNTGKVGKPQNDRAAGAPLRVVNVNSASAAELETLPGIGPALAARIIAQRAKGRFSSLEDLDAVSGLGPKKLEDLKPYVTF